MVLEQMNLESKKHIHIMQERLYLWKEEITNVQDPINRPYKEYLFKLNHKKNT